MNNEIKALREPVMQAIINSRFVSNETAVDSVLSVFEHWIDKQSANAVFFAHEHQLEQCGKGEITGLDAHNKAACDEASVILTPLYRMQPLSGTSIDTQSKQDNADCSEPTSYLERFTHALALLCGKEPPQEIVLAWIQKDSDDFRLQEFAIEHGPSWSQGIALIEAAQLMADQPTEGVDHEMRGQDESKVQSVQSQEKPINANAWKEIAEFQYALRQYPNQPELGQGALDAFAQQWPGFQAAAERHMEKLKAAPKRTEFVKPPKNEFRSQAENAADEGYHAQMDNLCLSHNPYVENCENWFLWRRGWLSAEADNKM